MDPPTDSGEHGVMREPGRWPRRALALTASLIVAAGTLVGCSGDDDSSSGDDGSDDAPTAGTSDDGGVDADTVGSGPVQLSIDGADYRLEPDVCGLGDSFSGPDGRVLVAMGEGGFPKLDLAYNPEAPETDGVTLTLSDGGYRTDANGLVLAVTPQGAVGTATLSSTSSSDEVTIAFEYECPDAESSASGDDEEPSSGSDESSDEGPDASSDKTGFIEWNGSRTDYDSADGDLDPLAGTGLCETEDVTGLEGDDYYRISVNLDDGTNFHATSSGDFELGETLNPIETSDVSVTKDGRTVSGTATTPQGELEFSFSC